MDDRPNTVGRPWPVSPVQFPLRGPSRGPVYVPPQPRSLLERFKWR